MKCIRCGKEIEKLDLFCGYCGIDILKYQKYLDKVSKKIHKDRDKEYNRNVSDAQKKLKQLEESKIKEIKRIESSRWESIGNKFSFNMTEGKILINGTEYLFSDINGAEIVKKESVRIVTNSTSTGNSKSKKHASLGGGLIGAAVAGPVGAVVGGSVLGKTTTKGKQNVVTNSNEIPTCHHIGVNVDINGFQTEIVLLINTIDQNNGIYLNLINTAQNIVDKLRVLSKTAVPKSYKKPEEEESVIKIDNEIEQAAKDLQKAKENKPNYDIPDSYLK